jgi:large subunit ribosomal protein L25
MQEVTLEAEIRNDVGKRARRLRREGKIPGVFYIHGEDNITIAVSERGLHKFLQSAETHIINLKLNDGRTKNCILRDVQFDPVTDRPLHVDFQGFRADEKVTLEIPVTIIGGTPKGVKEGGVLQHVMHKLRITCLPKDIPQHVEVNAEELAINHSIHVRDISVPNVTVLDSPDNTVVAVIPPTIEKVAEPGVAPAEEITEPEVIAKGKKEEEGEEGAEEKPEAKKVEAKKADDSTRREAKAETPKKEPKKEEKK